MSKITFKSIADQYNIYEDKPNQYGVTEWETLADEHASKMIMWKQKYEKLQKEIEGE